MTMRFFFFAATSLILGACQTGLPGQDRAPVLDDRIMSIKSADNRRIPLRVIQPSGCDASCPLVIFSHGAFSTYDRYDAILLPIARAGYRVVSPNHVDSEEHPDKESYPIDQSLKYRVEDYQTIAAHFDAPFTAALGHSYGALIAQMAGGAIYNDPQHAELLSQFALPDTVIAVSPPGPLEGTMDASGWSQIKVPMLVVTGTTDVVPGIAETWQQHLVSYEAAPDGKAYSLVYSEFDHYLNGAYGRERDPSSPQELANRQSALKHLTTSISAFMNAAEKRTHITPDNWSKRSNDLVSATAH